MKKIFLIAAVGLIFTSCKKSSSGLSSGTIQASIDGKSYTFNFGAYGETTPGGYSYFYAQDSVGLLANSFEADIYSYDGLDNPLALTKRTYQSDDSTELDIYFTPHQDWSDSSYRNANGKPFSITVTNAVLPNIKGNFSGVLYLQGDTTLASKNVTGSFNISSVETNNY
ncbi:MAG TPA: hypothetical protein VK559_03175 [Ferruginibacter sp.]|nr:hypothetical protein [Ferruginibacter sp.]